VALVEVRDLVKRYPEAKVNAVDGVSFDIEAGEVFALLGPNGAGKTTAISIISTLLPPTSGTVSVAGVSIAADPMAVRRNIGVVPQELALYDELSAVENLRFWGQMRGLNEARLRVEVDDKLALTGLTEHGHERVHTFSGGMKRRLNLAVGLLGDPPLVMLDEPTVAIDPQSRRHILDWVKELGQRGVTVLYTTHYMEEAQELSRRIGIIDQGRLIALGTLPELIRLVGQHETLILQLVQEGGGAELAARLQDLGECLQASAEDGQVGLNVVSAQEALPRIIGRAAELGLNVRTVEIREPNLESVFLHLTGRALRD
jgi:ABC-2 type transport system ATP-binding protein